MIMPLESASECLLSKGAGLAEKCLFRWYLLNLRHFDFRMPLEHGFLLLSDKLSNKVRVFLAVMKSSRAMC